MKSILRKVLCFYAREFPDHYKKEGLVIKASDFLGLDSKKLLPAHLWFGGLVLCNLYDYVQKRIYYFGTHENRTESLVWKLVKPGINVLDVGANIGIYSLLAAKGIGVNGKVISVEPVPITVQQFLRNMELNGYKNITLCRAAAWQENTVAQMACSEGNNCGTYSIVTEGFEKTFINVKGIRLDNLVLELGLSRVDLIKMDVEGAELPALKGAQNILSRNRPILVLEIDPMLTLKFGYTPEDLWGYLRKFQYNCYAIREKGYFYPKNGRRSVLKVPGPSIRDNYLFLPEGVFPPESD